MIRGASFAAPYLLPPAGARAFHRSRPATRSSSVTGRSTPTSARPSTTSSRAIPLIAPWDVDFFSARVGHFQHQPELNVLLDQLWVQ